MKSFSLLIPLLSLAVAACSSGSSNTNDDESGSGGAAGSGGGGDAGSAGEGQAGSGGGGDAGAGGGDGEGGLDNLSNVPADAIDYEGLSGITFSGGSIDTSSGRVNGYRAEDLGFQYFKVDQAGGGPRLGVFVFENVEIPASAVVRVDGEHPLVLVARDRIDISGHLLAAVNGTTAAAGGFSCTASGEGGGPGGGFATTGGGGSFCGVGAERSGTPYGTAELVPLIGGSSGGSARGSDDGGAGGGAIQLVAGVQINVGIGGTVSVGGGGVSHFARAGGGSGGAILLEAPSVTMAGTLAANGGAGKGDINGDEARNGLPNARPAEGSEGGGNGSAADTVDGGDGEDGLGGGGGAGRIRINSDPDQTTITGVISPSLSTECFSQGVLAG